jgi:serine/threonine protein kinase
MAKRVNSIKPNEFDRTYKLGKRIGSGAFGDVYEAKSRINGIKVAVKKIQLPQDEECRKQITKEVESMRICNHENIIKCFHFTTKHESGDGKKYL